MARGLSDRASSSLFSSVLPSFRALSGRLEFTVRLYKSNKDPFSRQNAFRFPVGMDSQDAFIVHLSEWIPSRVDDIVSVSPKPIPPKQHV